MPFPMFALRPVLKSAEKHRLFIAFPLFLGMLGMSVLSGLRAEVIVQDAPENGVIRTVKDHPETLVLGNKAVARAMPGAIILDDETMPILSDGDALIVSPKDFSVSVKGLTLTGFDGALQVIRTNDVVTVVALTTPVLVHGSGGSVLIPVRRQWTVPSALHAPEEGMQRWLTERTTVAVTEDQLRIQLPVVANMMGIDNRRADIAFVHDFASTSTGWLLGAFHPATRDLTWTLPRSASETREQHLLSLISFLPSDLLPEPVSSIAFERWEQALKEYLSMEDNVGIRVMIGEQAKEFSAEMMPERKERALKSVSMYSR